MRSIEYLIQLFPDKTGKELLEIQNQDKLEDKKNFQKQNEKKLELINDINTNGGYYRGRFGLNQHYFYRVYNLRLDGNYIYMDVEKLIFFIEQDHLVSIELKNSIFQKEEKFGLEKRERVTKKDWDEVNEYVKNIAKFWKDIKPV